MSKFKEVSEAEFRDFLATYPNPLLFDVARMLEPPLATYNDVTIAEKWPETVVASHSYDYHTDKPERFRIMVQETGE